MIFAIEFSLNPTRWAPPLTKPLYAFCIWSYTFPIQLVYLNSDMGFFVNLVDKKGTV